MNNPLISICLPTRGRFDLLKGSIESLLNNANDPNNFELLLGIDEDDLETLQKAKQFSEQNKNLNIRYSISERYGYKELHKYLNDLCKISKGELIFLWNDDARIDTKNWDLKIKKYSEENEKMLFLFLNNVRPQNMNWNFPLVNRRVCETLGFFSCTPHNDTFYEFLKNSFNENEHWFQDLDIELFHLQSERMYDAKSDTDYDLIYKEIDEAKKTTSPEFYEKAPIVIHYCQLRIKSELFHDEESRQILNGWITGNNDQNAILSDRIDEEWRKAEPENFYEKNIKDLDIKL